MTRRMARPRRPSSSGMRAEEGTEEERFLAAGDMMGGGMGAESDTVGNGGLHAIEEEEAAEKDEEDSGGGSDEQRSGRSAVTGESPAETIDDAGHGIEAVEPAPADGYERGRVGDGRSEHPELDEKRSDVFDVAIESVESGKPEADAESGGNGEQD